MRKLITATAVGAVALSLAAPAVGAPKAPKAPHTGTGAITLAATPSTVTDTTTTVTVTGNLKANKGCKKDRTVRFSYGATALAVTATTASNGDFTAVLPKPTDAGPATVTLTATTDAAERKVGSKKKGKKSKKGRKINCASNTGSTTVTVAAPVVPAP
jgi:hypothetical protein